MSYWVIDERGASDNLWFGEFDTVEEAIARISEYGARQFDIDYTKIVHGEQLDLVLVDGKIQVKK